MQTAPVTAPAYTAYSIHTISTANHEVYSILQTHQPRIRTQQGPRVQCDACAIWTLQSTWSQHVSRCSTQLQSDVSFPAAMFDNKPNKTRNLTETTNSHFATSRDHSAAVSSHTAASLPLVNLDIAPPQPTLELSGPAYSAILYEYWRDYYANVPQSLDIPLHEPQFASRQPSQPSSQPSRSSECSINSTSARSSLSSIASSMSRPPVQPPKKLCSFARHAIILSDPLVHPQQDKSSNKKLPIVEPKSVYCASCEKTVKLSNPYSLGLWFAHCATNHGRDKTAQNRMIEAVLEAAKVAIAAELERLRDHPGVCATRNGGHDVQCASCRGWTTTFDLHRCPRGPPVLSIDAATNPEGTAMPSIPPKSQTPEHHPNPNCAADSARPRLNLSLPAARPASEIGSAVSPARSMFTAHTPTTIISTAPTTPAAPNFDPVVMQLSARDISSRRSPAPPLSDVHVHQHPSLDPVLSTLPPSAEDAASKSDAELEPEHEANLHHLADSLSGVTRQFVLKYDELAGEFGAKKVFCKVCECDIVLSGGMNPRGWWNHCIAKHERTANQASHLVDQVLKDHADEISVEEQRVRSDPRVRSVRGHDLQCNGCGRWMMSIHGHRCDHRAKSRSTRSRGLSTPTDFSSLSPSASTLTPKRKAEADITDDPLARKRARSTDIESELSEPSSDSLLK